MAAVSVKRSIAMHLRSAPGVGGLKGHSQLWDRADLDTTFESLKSFYLNPKSSLRVGYI